MDIAPFTLERTIDEGKVKVKGLHSEVAYLYIKHGNMSVIARKLSEKYRKNYKMQQIKRLLMKFCREQLRIEVKRGKPKKLKEN